MKRIVCIACLGALVAACSSTPEKDNAAPVDERNALGAGVAAPPSSTNPAGGSSLSGSAIPPTASLAQPSAGRSPLNDPRNPLSKRSVYYDFDSFVIKDEFKPLVEAHGRY